MNADDSAQESAQPGAQDTARVGAQPGVQDGAAPSETRRWVSVTSVWFASLAGAVAVGLFTPAAQFFTWLPLVLALVVVMTFAIQLSLQNKVGLVSRIAMSLGGALVILMVATLIMLPTLFAGA